MSVQHRNKEGILRRMTKIAAVATIAALALTGCGKNDAGSGDNKGSSASNDVCKDAKGDGPKVGLAYDVGGRGDQSFNDSAYAGLAKAVERARRPRCTEGEAQRRRGRVGPRGRACATWPTPAATRSSVWASPTARPSTRCPPTTPTSASPSSTASTRPTTKANDNVAYLGFAENEGSFLVGVAAAQKTKANHIGFVGGVHNDLIKKFEAGYVAGAKAVDPSIKVDVKYIEESDLSGFNDPAGGKQAAAAEYDNGADVVYHAAGASGSGVFDAAVEAGDGKWAIGVDSDQYLTAPEPTSSRTSSPRCSSASTWRRSTWSSRSPTARR